MYVTFDNIYMLRSEILHCSISGVLLFEGPTGKWQLIAAWLPGIDILMQQLKGSIVGLSQYCCNGFSPCLMPLPSFIGVKSLHLGLNLGDCVTRAINMYIYI